MEDEEEEQEFYLQNGNNQQFQDDPNYPRPGHCRMDRRRTSYAHRAVLAVENVARRMSMPAFTVDTIAQNLEEEIERDSEEPKGNFEKIQRSGEQILHSKKILLLIVVLNIIDCALVLAELILDIHFIKDMVHEAEDLLYKFTTILLQTFPAIFIGLETGEVADIFNKVIDVITSYNQTTDIYLNLSTNSNVTYSYRSRRLAALAGIQKDFFTNADLPAFLESDQKHHLVEDLAHAFHKASIIILGILVLLTLLKVFCYGSTLFKKKFELFDGLIVVTSFVIDIALIKGIMGYPLEDAVETLAFLIPWRVIRVANSLVMAVMDEAHLQLKMIYTEKKAVEEKYEEAESNLKYQKNVNKILRDLCISEGIPMSKISEKTAGCEMPRFVIRDRKRIHLSRIRKKLNCFTSQEDGNSLPYGHSIPHLYRKNGIYSVDPYNSSDDGKATPSDGTLSRRSTMLSIPESTPHVVPDIRIQDSEEINDTSAIIVQENDEEGKSLQRLSPGKYRKAHNYVKRNHLETAISERKH
ncbi:uncharacterized protein LOC132559748 [Ylistrum balloti]|uniref:uncharacterized protein LOC132559748 n=1 Tax=Ylistrum balloti TaxID=509963 RepID=UPI002905C6C8|nr:uncharacterized protein LOC132559748 [Ylistrum balloti]